MYRWPPDKITPLLHVCKQAKLTLTHIENCCQTRPGVGNYFPWWATLSQWTWLLDSILTNVTAFNMLIFFIYVTPGGTCGPDAS